MPNTKNLEQKPTPSPEKLPTVSVDLPIEIQKEYGGPKGKEPTRYGDWEKKGRCIDF